MRPRTLRYPEVGDVYAGWTVIGVAGSFSVCMCDCGGVHQVASKTLINGASTRCRSCAGRDRKFLGLSKCGFTLEHSERLRQVVWSAINSYGERVCSEWLENPSKFADHLLTLVGHNDKDLILRRIQRQGRYEPGNLHFVKRSTNVRGLTAKFRSEYGSWKAMISRCYDESSVGFENYGGRGIKVCNEWRHSFDAFLKDVGPKPSPALSIERIDNNLPYGPGNCKWATDQEQNRNKRNNTLLSFNGRVLCVSEWAEELQVSSEVILERLKNGWTVDKSLTTPKRIYRAKK